LPSTPALRTLVQEVLLQWFRFPYAILPKLGFSKQGVERLQKPVFCSVPLLSSLNLSFLHRQNYSEPCFALHHASVSIDSLFKRKRLDHRPNILQDAKGKGVLAFDRCARQGSVD